jgi:glutaminase
MRWVWSLQGQNVTLEAPFARRRAGHRHSDGTALAIRTTSRLSGEGEAVKVVACERSNCLPERSLAQRLIDEAHERFRTNTEGTTSRIYPALARVPGDVFGICVAGVGGSVVSAGDADTGLTIMGVAKPFLYALVCRQLGRERLRALIGVNATGLPFNSLTAVEQSGDGRTNPMVNPGAVAATSLVPGAGTAEKWQFIRDGLSGFAGRVLALDEDVYRSGSTPNRQRRSTCTRAKAA